MLIAQHSIHQSHWNILLDILKQVIVSERVRINSNLYRPGDRLSETKAVLLRVDWETFPTHSLRQEGFEKKFECLVLYSSVTDAWNVGLSAMLRASRWILCSEQFNCRVLQLNIVLYQHVL